jgi:hypothetical protein
MRAAKRRAGAWLLGLVALVASPALATTTLPPPATSAAAMIDRVTVDGLAVTVAAAVRSAASPAVSSLPDSGFSLRPAPLGDYGQLFERGAHLVEPLPSFDVEPLRLPETRVRAFALFDTPARLPSNRVSDGNATGFGLCLVETCDRPIQSWLSEDPLGAVDSQNLYAFVGHAPNMSTDPLGLYSWREFGRDVEFWGDVALGTQANLQDPRNAVKNVQRAAGGLVGTGKMVGTTVVGLASLVADNAGPIPNPDAMMRNVQRAQAIEQFAAHPVDTVVQAHKRVIAQVEAHEAKGEYFSGGIASGELASGDAAAVLGAAEAGVGLARLGVRAATGIARSAASAEAGAAASVETGAAAGSGASAESAAARQTMATGREWYDNFVEQYGAENVEWVGGSGRTVPWPSEFDLPQGSMFRTRSPQPRSSSFIPELESVAGPRPPGSVGHHVKPLMCNGVDCGATNGAWVQEGAHVSGHNKIKAIERLPLGTEIVARPPGT